MTEIDSYIADIKDTHEKKALEDLRKTLHEFLPDALECISYGMPAFRVKGTCVAGFARFKNHLTFFPFSGTTLSSFTSELDTLGFTYTKSGVHFTSEKPIPKELIQNIIQSRLRESSY